MKEVSAILTFDFNYSSSEDVFCFWLSTIRWSPVNSDLLLAFSPKHLMVLLRNIKSLTPIKVQRGEFDHISDIQFLPSNTKCMY